VFLIAVVRTQPNAGKKVQPKQHPSQIPKARLNCGDCCKNMVGILSVKLLNLPTASSEEGSVEMLG
jgi:hypothetical protein